MHPTRARWIAGIAPACSCPHFSDPPMRAGAARRPASPLFSGSRQRTCSHGPGSSSGDSPSFHRLEPHRALANRERAASTGLADDMVVIPTRARTLYIAKGAFRNMRRACEWEPRAATESERVRWALDERCEPPGGATAESGRTTRCLARSRTPSVVPSCAQ
jgi:hypothetical protein